MKTKNIRIIFFIGSFLPALIALGIPFPVAEDGYMEEQTLIAEADSDRRSKTADLTMSPARDVAFDDEVTPSPDAADLFGSDGLKTVGIQADGEGAAEQEFGRLHVTAPKYKAKSLEAGDILPVISAGSSGDKKIIGVVIPPIAYFGLRF